FQGCHTAPRSGKICEDLGSELGLSRENHAPITVWCCVGWSEATVLAMNLQISRESEVPIREQLAEQIVFLIVTEKLKPQEVLPSVRQLARRLKIHHNTVSHVYAD